jgi:hypothetical protein
VSGSDPTFINRIGRSLGRVYPNADRDAWRLYRTRDTRAPRKVLERIAQTLTFARGTRDSDVHLIVVVHDGPGIPNFHLAGGNHFFEVHQSAVEVLGAENVTLFGVAKDEPTHAWQERLLRTVSETAATHLFCQIEIDPNQGSNWNWDVIVPVLDQYWGGPIIGMMYDAAYEWLRHRAHRLGRQADSLLIAELCQPMDGFVRKGRYEVGPMTMPISQASIAVIDERVRDLRKEFDVSFVGALYDYRQVLLDRIAATGLSVAINPHRQDVASTFEESRTNQPTYVDYMAGLARSELTINFSLANGGPSEQYKIRVHEASLVGTICLTDDKDRTRLFYPPNEYQYFPSIDALPAVIETRLHDRDALHRDQEGARQRAHELSRYDFWGRIEYGLQRRGMRRLTGISSPTPPPS